MFEGNWVFTNGSTSLTITLQKKIMGQISSSITNKTFYTDAIIGEYKYIENGIVKINTLHNLLNNELNPFNYNITMVGVSIASDINTCINCQLGNIYMRGSYTEPNCDQWMYPLMSMRYFVENGVEK